MNYEVWEEHFRGFSIVDCAIPNEHRIYFCLKQNPEENMPTQEDDDLITKIVINRRDESPPNDWVYRELSGLKYPKVTYSIIPDFRLIAVDFYGRVFVLGGGTVEFENDIPLIQGTSVTEATCIRGYTYAIGTSRSVFQRVNKNKWKPLRSGLKTEASEGEDEFDWGFTAIDGFNENDIYAGGGLGDLWNFDGKLWRQVDVPTNVEINGLCCGGDGVVYAVGNGGSIIAGRNDNWAKIEQDLVTDDLDEIVWYRDRAYIATWMGLFELQNGKLTEVNVTCEDSQYSFGHACAGSGLFLSAGPKEAFLFDGQAWQVLVPDYEE